MIDGGRVLAIVPARGGSKGLPRKNLRQLGGRPLVAWPIAAARGTPVIDRVVLSTDDAEIAAAGREAGADVPFMRPPQLADDSASSADVVCHALEALRSGGETYDYLILLEPTSPLTEPDDVARALRRLHASRDRADAIVGISRVVAHHPEYNVLLGPDGVIRPQTTAQFGSAKRRQDIEDVYFMEGSLYASAVDVFLKRRTFCHERTLGYPVPRWKALEIDELMDLVCVEALLARRSELRSDFA